MVDPPSRTSLAFLPVLNRARVYSKDPSISLALSINTPSRSNKAVVIVFFILYTHYLKYIGKSREIVPILTNSSFLLLCIFQYAIVSLMPTFNLRSDWKPAGDQPKAIDALNAGLKKGMRHQTLLGVTGSGKTFTAANVIAQYGKPTLVIAHNKTLAAQLAQEYREFFPDNAVHYFVSYYDFYQPEAYMPATDTYIEKEAMINEEIDRLRHASTQALLSRKDVIIVASVSCIYGLGSPEEYQKVNVQIATGQKISRADFIRELIDIHFERTTADLSPGQFRAIGNTVEIMPVSEKFIYRMEIADGEVKNILK